MSDDKPKLIANLGDADPIENGGLFVFQNADGSYFMEKLEEPCDDDQCEECEDEPTDLIYDRRCETDYAHRVYPGEYVLVGLDTHAVLAHGTDLVKAWKYAVWLYSDMSDPIDEQDHETLLVAIPRGGIGVISPLNGLPRAAVACEQAVNLFVGHTRLDEQIAIYEQAIQRIKDAYKPSIEAEAALEQEHAAWKKHVAEHERWMVYRVDLERFDTERVYDGEACLCEAPDGADQVWWDDHYKVCPFRPLRITGLLREWFYDSLGGIASYAGTTRYALIKALCSDDPYALAFAWREILDYHGWANGDGYPLQLSRPDVEKRYEGII